MVTASNWMEMHSGVHENGPESSAEPSALGLMCQAGVHVLLFYWETTERHRFLEGGEVYFIFFYFLTFHIEITSDFQKHCRNSTRILCRPSTHLPQMLTSCMPIAK